MSGDEVRAAGGLVWRQGRSGRPEVLVVHRPRYDDWSLPKGKADPGERDEDTARREVEEETGWRCELEAPAGTVRYRDRHDRPKVVRYWTMRPLENTGGFTPNDEVDAVEWWDVDEAAHRLTYDRDRALARELEPSERPDRA